MKTILFVCTGNTCRSAMAEALLKARIDAAKKTDAFEVRSAGLFAQRGDPASPAAQEAVQRWDGDLSRHCAEVIRFDLLQSSQLILTMTKQHKRGVLFEWPQFSFRTHTLGEYTGIAADIPDPFGQGVAAYERCAEMLERQVDVLWKKLQEAAR